MERARKGGDASPIMRLSLPHVNRSVFIMPGVRAMADKEFNEKTIREPTALQSIKGIIRRSGND